MKRIYLVLAILLALPAFMFASPAQQSGGGEIRFAWWGNPTRDEQTLQILELYKQKTGVTVQPETTNFAGYWDQLAAQIAAQSLPDVMQMDYAYIAQYSSRNLLEDLTPYSNQSAYAVTSNRISLAGWSDAGLSGGRVNGKLVALNLGVNAWGMEVDAGVLQSAGVTINDSSWTWREFEAAALQIYQRTQVQTMPSNEHYQIIEHIVRQYGSPMYSADGRSLGFTTNLQAIAAIKEYIDMQLRLKAAGALYDPADGFVQGLAMPDTPFIKGNTWNNYNWSNQHEGYSNAAGANRPLNYYLFPSSTGRAPYGTYIKPSMLISMLSSSTKKDMAAQFINFFVNDLDAGRIRQFERGVPVPTAVLNSLTSILSPTNKAVSDYVTRATPLSSPIDPPDPTAAGEARDAMRPILLQALMGTISSEAAVAGMIVAANAVLGR